jgi:hypothetical protein
MACSRAANDRACRRTHARTLTNWSVTRAENETAQRNKQNDPEKVLFHRLSMSLN